MEDKNYLLNEYYSLLNYSSPMENSLNQKERSVNKETLITQLLETVKKCKKCDLWKTRKNLVFGEGSLNAKVMFIGEAPGREENNTGRPFVGRAGKKLTEMIEHPRSLGIPRKDVYICNILKCWPPNNRNPKQNEIEACTPFLLKQIEIIKPKVICALGTFAARWLLKTKAPITSLRGKVGYFMGIPVVPTFHPSYIIRNLADTERRRKAWQDMLKIKEILNKGEVNNEH